MCAPLLQTNPPNYTDRLITPYKAKKAPRRALFWLYRSQGQLIAVVAFAMTVAFLVMVVLVSFISFAIQLLGLAGG